MAIRDITEAWATLTLMGPRSRDVLVKVTDADVSNAGFPFGHLRRLRIAGAEVRALRITYAGELGWELHLPVGDAVAVFDALMAAGAAEGIRPVGYRALESLRLEKGYRAWSSDITPNDTPLEAGLGWAVKLGGSAAFLGREALEAARGKPLAKRFAGFLLDDARAVLVGRETILRNGRPVGYLTSGGYAHTLGCPVGYGYVRNPDGATESFLREGSYALVVAGETFPARLELGPLYDPANRRIRG